MCHEQHIDLSMMHTPPPLTIHTQSYKQACEKYKDTGTSARIRKLDQLASVSVHHRVDATALPRSFPTSTYANAMDVIMFNFPHTGMQRAHLNRNLIRDFLASAAVFLRKGHPRGEVHVTLKDAPPYDRWGLAKIAAEVEPAFRVVRDWRFDSALYPGGGAFAFDT